MIVLHLMHLGMLQKSALYLSDFFERHKGEYYEALTLVRQQDDMDQCLLFFLSGIVETAKKGRETLRRIIDLHKKYKEKVMTLGRSAKTANALLSFAFSDPAFDMKKVAESINVSKPTAYNTVKKLMEIGVIKEITGFSRNQVFILYEYVDPFKG